MVPAILLMFGLAIGLVVAPRLDEILSDAELQIPNLLSFGSPPWTFHVSIPAILRVVAILFVVVAVLWFLIVRSHDTK